MVHQWYIENLRDRFTRRVVHGRPKPAGSDDDIGAHQRFLQRGGNALDIIAHGRQPV